MLNNTMLLIVFAASCGSIRSEVLPSRIQLHAESHWAHASTMRGYGRSPYVRIILPSL
jgi:hypothetical protein